jgi:hypothetical protein
MTASSPGKGAAAFPLSESPRGHVVFHHGELLELVLDGACMVWIGSFKKLLQVVVWLPRRALEIRLGGCDILLIGVVHFLVVIVIVAVCDCDLLGHCFCPFLLPLALLLASLPVALGGAPRLLPGTIFPSPCTKMARTASSPEACGVAMSSSSFTIFGCVTSQNSHFRM